MDGCRGTEWLVGAEWSRIAIVRKFYLGGVVSLLPREVSFRILQINQPPPTTAHPFLCTQISTNSTNDWEL